jgi:hypothetical protein
MKNITLLLILIVATTIAQDRPQPTNNLFDDFELKAFAPGSIMVEGEVQNPGPVQLSGLPVQNIPIKAMSVEGAKTEFKGAYFVSGYSLCDILNLKTVKKVPENKFSPPVDLYAIVENDKGDKAAVSWGEIYYRDSHNILISSSIRAVNPARGATKWPLPTESQLICGNDLLNARTIGNPTKITIKSFRGSFPSEKPKDPYSPGFRILGKSGAVEIKDIDSAVEKRACGNVLYGHGMGFKEVLNVKGFVLKDLIESKTKTTSLDLRKTIAVVSAKDGYRVVFSLSELLNRNDYQDLLLVDKKDSSSDGRYLLIVTGDYFADRNVKSIEKIEMMEAE